jgi:hypothetical protein
MSENFASYDGFEVSVGNERNTALASADMATIGAGRHAVASVEMHAAPLHTPDLGQNSGLVLA